jgi:hypothetical protein
MKHAASKGHLEKDFLLISLIILISGYDRLSYIVKKKHPSFLLFYEQLALIIF